MSFVGERIGGYSGENVDDEWGFPVDEERGMYGLNNWTRVNEADPKMSSLLRDCLLLYRIFCDKITPLDPSLGISGRKPMKPYAERARKLCDYFEATLFNANNFVKMCAENGDFQLLVRDFFKQNKSKYDLSERSSDVLRWFALFKDEDFVFMAADFWEEHYGQHQTELRKQLIEAVDILNARRHVEELGQTTIDELRGPPPVPWLEREINASGGWGEVVLSWLGMDFLLAEPEEDIKWPNPPPKPEPKKPEETKLGMMMLLRLRVEEVLERVYKTLERVDELQSFATIQEVSPFGELQRNVRAFFNQHPEDLEFLKHLNGSEKSIYQIQDALYFRLALFPYNSNHYDFPAVLRPYEPFDEECLRANAFASAHAFVEELRRQQDLDRYIVNHPPTDTETLSNVRTRILFSSLKLAQNKARIKWPEGRVTERALRAEIILMNNVLGEMGLTVRQGGPHLKGQLEIQRALTEAVVCKELYGDDPHYAKKVMADFGKYTLDSDSFIISIDIGPLKSVGEILMAKIEDEPLTYTVEFLYVDKDYREDYQLGTLVQNIVHSLVSPNARLVATVYSANENMPRHFKRGWVATGLINTGKTLGLQIYEGEFKEKRVERAENHEAFKTLCERYLNQGDYLLTSIEPDSESIDLFPCRVHFKKALTPPKEGFYKHDSH